MEDVDLSLSVCRSLERDGDNAVRVRHARALQAANKLDQAHGHASSGKAVEHVGFTCDRCGMTPIVGTRLTCRACQYDVCSSRECASKRHAHALEPVVVSEQRVLSVELCGFRTQNQPKTTQKEVNLQQRSDCTHAAPVAHLLLLSQMTMTRSPRFHFHT